MSLEEIVKEYEKQYNLGKLVFDKEGICRLLVDDELFISLENTFDGSGFFHYTTVGIISASYEGELGLEALAGNLFGKETGKASLGYDPNTRMLVLFEFFPDTTSFEIYDPQLKKFITTANYWIDKLAEVMHEPQRKVSLKKHIEALEDYEKMQLFFA